MLMATVRSPLSGTLPSQSAASARCSWQCLCRVRAPCGRTSRNSSALPPCSPPRPKAATRTFFRRWSATTPWFHAELLHGASKPRGATTPWASAVSSFCCAGTSACLGQLVIAPISDCSAGTTAVGGNGLGKLRPPKRNRRCPSARSKPPGFARKRSIRPRCVPLPSHTATPSCCRLG